jgi:WD40 repeat protein
MNDPNFYRYDPQTGREEKIEVSVQGAYPRLFSSPDGQLIGIPSHLPTIIDRTGAVVVQTFPHSYGEDARRSTYQWSPNSEWVMIDYRVTFAGGGRPEPDVGVVFDIAGTTRRELPYQGFNGFLPDGATPYLSPGEPVSALKEPVLLLPQAGYVRAVGWHPTDPDRLVTFSADGGLIFWSLANDDPQITEQIPVKYLREELYQVEGTLYWMPESDVVVVFKNGGLHILDPQLDHLPVFDGDEGFTPYAADARDGVAFVGSRYSCCIAVISTEDRHLVDQFYGTAVSLAISADGRRLATTSAGMTAIWDISEYLPTD